MIVFEWVSVRMGLMGGAKLCFNVDLYELSVSFGRSWVMQFPQILMA